MGWSTFRRRTESHAGAAPRRSASSAPAARRRSARPRHVARRRGDLLLARCTCFPARAPRAGRFLSRGFPDHSLHNPERSRASHSGGRYRPGALERGTRSCHPHRTRRQPRARSQWSIWGDRYHARALTTPRAVRKRPRVLNNFRKHLKHVTGIDPCSCAAWFTGWSERPALDASGPPPVAAARTWLARVGWLRHGAIELHEQPK